MANIRNEALTALRMLTGKSSYTISDEDLIMFQKESKEMEQYNKRLGEIYDAIFYGFFNCAAKGTDLYRLDRVSEKFGNSIENNYPEANKTFINFAKTYWTLRVLVYDLMDEDMEWIGAQLLTKLEQDIGPAFFPFPVSWTT